jgi:hypothetical protein
VPGADNGVLRLLCHQTKPKPNQFWLNVFFTANFRVKLDLTLTKPSQEEEVRNVVDIPLIVKGQLIDRCAV